MATPSSNPDSLQIELKQLQSENQVLLEQEATLLSQLAIIHQQLTASTKQIIVKMDDILTQLITDQRAQAQADFWDGFNKSDNVFRGLSKSMDGDPNLMAAVQAVAAEASTDAQQKTVLLALLTELSGQPASILSTIAQRAIQHNGKGQPLAQSIAGLAANTPLEIMDLDEPADAIRDQSIVSLDDTEVKSENPSPIFSTDSSTTAVAGGGGALERLLSTPTPARQGSQANANIQATASLQRSYPDLLQDLCHTPAVRPIAKPALTSITGSAKRDQSPPESGRATKKLKPMKEVAIPAAFSLLMKKLEVAHAQNALPIADLLKCSKCQQIKRDSRVLNCLHVYCHRCTQKLRIEAEKGDAFHGFKAYCVREGCTEVVSGKTAVIDAEVMEFLVWYDKQSPGLSTSLAQLQVLKAAHKRRPGEILIKTHLADVRKKMKARETVGENDQICNLLEVAKLAKKLS